VQQQMADDVLSILAPQKGILMRQRLDLLEVIFGWEQRNKYGVATKPVGRGNSASEWQDDTFRDQLRQGHLLTLKEESECCERQCCRPYHSLSIKVKGGQETRSDGVNLAEFDRPFKCTMVCCGVLCNPQTITAKINGNVTGQVVQHWPCSNNFLCCHRYWRVLDADGKDKYMIHQDFCCNENMCAPSMCCPVNTIDILTPDQSQKVGQIVDIWPGCNARGCIGTYDNYIMDFPDAATPTDKLNLLAALILIEYMVFEKKQKKNNGNADAGLLVGGVVGGIL